jgi:hypothetical protein
MLSMPARQVDRQSMHPGVAAFTTPDSLTSTSSRSHPSNRPVEETHPVTLQ